MSTPETTVQNPPPELVKLTDLDGMRAAGIRHPSTVDGWRWAYRTRKERGIENAFKRQGRSILLDVVAYKAGVRNQPSV